MAYRLVLPLADVGQGIVPSDGAKLYIYEPGTTTPKASYTDFALTPGFENTHPVIADSEGVFTDIFIDGQADITLHDKNNELQWGPNRVYPPLQNLDTDTVAGLIYPATTAEDSAGVVPADLRFQMFDIRRYGADGVADRDAWYDCFKVIVANGGGIVYVPPGFHSVVESPIGEISLRTGVNGDFTAPVTRSFQVVADGARVDYSGSGFMFAVQGTGFSASDPRRFDMVGGTYTHTGTATALLRGRDLGRAGFTLEALVGFGTYGILLQNWYGFSENICITGPGGTRTALLDNGIAVACMGITAAEAYEGVSGQGGTSSFARFNMVNIQYGTIANGPVNNRMLLVDANVYDSDVHTVTGNMVNRDAGATTGTTSLIEIGANGTMSNTKIYGFKLEGAGDGAGAQAYIVDASGATLSINQTPTVYDTDWDGASNVITHVGFPDDYSTTSALPFQTAVEMGAGFGLTGRLIATLTQDEDDYSPTGIGNANVLELDGSGDWDIQSLAGGVGGRILVVINTGTGIRRLLDASGTTVGNRLSLAEDIILPPEGACILQYSASPEVRWKCIGLYSPDHNIYREVSAGNLADVGHVINTAGKYTGKVIWEITNGRGYRSSGGAAASEWQAFDDATNNVTPA